MCGYIFKEWNISEVLPRRNKTILVKWRKTSENNIFETTYSFIINIKKEWILSEKVVSCGLRHASDAISALVRLLRSAILAVPWEPTRRRPADAFVSQLTFPIAPRRSAVAPPRAAAILPTTHGSFHPLIWSTWYTRAEEC